MFIAKAPASVSGSGGHGQTFAVACALVVGFALSDADAWELLSEYNSRSCTPAWSEKELRHKLSEARKQADRNPSEVGKLVDQDRPDYSGPKQPPSASARSAQPAAQPSGRPAPPNPPARTARTPAIEIRRFGVGAEPRTVRTVRTLSFDSFTPKPTHSPAPVKVSKKIESERSEPAPVGCEVTYIDNDTGGAWRTDAMGRERFLGMIGKEKA